LEPRKPADFRNRRAGGVLAFTVISLTALLAMLGLVIDGGFIYSVRQRSQSAADSAALAAALALAYGDARMLVDANRMIAENNLLGSSATVTMTHPYKSDQSKVEVVVVSSYQPLFLGLVGVKRLSIGVRAVGQYVPGREDDQQVPFSVGLFGARSLSLSNNGQTDSYNSTIGPYGGTNVGSSGNAGSNGPVTLDNSIRVKGGCQTPGGPLTMSSSASIEGDVRVGGNINMTSTASIGGTAAANGTVTGSAQNTIGGLGVPPGYTTNPGSRSPP
jgi:Flp pilus assembly protein TadG